MISLRGFCIATLALAVREFDNVRAAHTWTSPVTFQYTSDYPNDNISVNIILKNVPAEADSYDLYYRTGNCYRSTAGQHSAARCDEPARHDTIPTNRTITIMQKLYRIDGGSLGIYIILGNENEICATKWIMYVISGIRNRITNFSDNQLFRTDCLNKRANLCDIIADFGNQCEELRAKIYCSQLQSLTCEVYKELPEDTVNYWYQEYKDGTLIGNIPPVKGNKTEFKMTIHKFDSNTYIFNGMSSTYWENDLITEILKVPLPRNGYENYVVEHVKKYTANEQVSFNCSNNTHTRIGWIEPSGNKIITYIKRKIAFSALTKEENNSMFCCLNYLTYTVGVKTIVERTVTDITVLIYEEPVNQDHVKGPTESPAPNNTSNDESPVPGNKTSGESPLQNNKTKDESSFTAGLLIGLAVVMGVAAVLACLVILYKKQCCRVKSTSEEPPQTYIARNPFYVNLLFRKECQAEIYAAEHVYEEIN